jgi:ribosomal protein S18 acetylase RimI-like enzyme
MLKIRRLKATDIDLAEIAEELNNKEHWGDFDDHFTRDSLQVFLEDDRRYYILAYLEGNIAGALHAYLLQHPSGKQYMYVDEVDTSKLHRRKGVATAMMREIIGIARRSGADEAWLGTEHDNGSAKALYESLSPDEIEHGPIYSYKLK